MMEHEWKKLYVKDEEWSIPTHTEYMEAGIDQCSKCGTLRRTVDGDTVYKPPHWNYNTVEEPTCKEIE